MRSWWKGLLTLVLFLTVGVLGLIGSSNVYAEDDSGPEANVGDYFQIYAASEVCTYANGDKVGCTTTGNPKDPNAPIEASAKIVYKGNGQYAVEDEDWGAMTGVMADLKAIQVSTDGGKLNLAVRTPCNEQSLTNGGVPFNSNIETFRRMINRQIKGTEWYSQCEVGGNTQSFTFWFSTTNVTVREEAPTADSDENNTVQATCINSGGLATLGWILCPALDVMNDASDNIYKTFLKPALQVDPKLFTDKGAATVDGWGTFRNIANIIFIILFLFVIFSQLTGIGIDNYGIKKILPKMILAAILINLSYWLCMVFVDLSNILGNSFQLMFDNLAAGGGSVDLSSIGGEVIGVSGTLISAGILAAFMAGGYAVFNNPAIMVTLLVSALGVLIAILFLFILLAAREAAIVVLVVLSPIAIICYMLPNTKTVFDKWLKFFKGLLLVYPIAGLLVGGGNYVSDLLLYVGQGDNGVFAAITAMIVGIVPIFFIPTVLKSAFSAMGNIGAKISGIGQRVSGAATGAARNSQAYKNAQERGRMRQTRIRAGVDADGNPIEMGRFGRAIRGGRGNIARNRAQYRQDQLNLGAQNDLLNNDVYGARLQADQEAQMVRGYQEQFANMDRGALEAEAANASNWLSQAGGEQRMSALIGAMEAQGMQDNIYSMLRNNNVSGMSNVMKALAGSNDKILKAYGKRGFNTDYNSFMTGTGANSLQGYAAEKGADFVNGLDDKSLAEIRAQDDASVAAGNGHIMSTDQLVQAASQLNSEDSMREVNAMLSRRTDIAGKVSGEQLVALNESTMKQLHGRGLLNDAIATVRGNPELAGKMSAERKAYLGI